MLFKVKTSTKIIIALLLTSASVGAYFVLKNPNKNKKRLLVDNPEFNTVNNFSAITVSKQLYEAMRNTGTDEDIVFETLTGLSENQFRLVINAFGLKPYNTVLGNQKTLIGSDVFGYKLPKHGLKSWLKNELSNEKYKLLKINFPKYL